MIIDGNKEAETVKNEIKKETAQKFKNIMPDLHKDFTKNN